MPNPNVIAVTGKEDDTVVCDKFNKSVQIIKCGKKSGYGKVEIKGKCNAVMIDSCQNLEVHVDTVMSTLEISNSKRVKLVMKPGANVLSVIVDKTDGVLIQLSKEANDNPDFQVIAAKSSEMNVAFTQKGEPVERCLPEQFVYKIDRSGPTAKIVSNVSDLYSPS